MASPTPSNADANGAVSKSGDGQNQSTTPAKAKRRYTVTPKVLAAHRANARKSTGPRSVAGKSRSRWNSLTHGLTAFKIGILLPGEDAAAYHELEQLVLQQYRPLGAVGAWALRELIDELWRSRRIALAETTLLAAQRAILAPEESRSCSLAACHLGQYGDLFKKVYAAFQDHPTEPTEELFKEIREAVANLRHDVPDFADFANAEATRANLDRFTEAFAGAWDRLIREEAQHDAREQAWCLTPANAFFVQDTQTELIFRYTARTDRRILMFLQVIAEYCRRAV